MRCVKSEVENMWISELGFSSLIFHLCIFTDAQSTILYYQLTMLQLLSAQGVFYWRADLGNSNFTLTSQPDFLYVKWQHLYQ